MIIERGPMPIVPDGLSVSLPRMRYDLEIWQKEKRKTIKFEYQGKSVELHAIVPVFLLIWFQFRAKAFQILC